MGQPDGLVEWLARCMDQDEAEACDWRDSHSPQFPSLVSPDRVLAQVAAHRAILDLHRPRVLPRSHPTHRCQECGDVDEAPVEWPCPTVRHLATTYADRDGYDPDWRPQ